MCQNLGGSHMVLFEKMALERNKEESFLVEREPLKCLESEKFWGMTKAQVWTKG